ncbi:peroxiredoxin family protein [Hymenobacter psychrophilus]|nr:hypothetical protein [Hymenobacter psychrophilus]
MKGSIGPVFTTMTNRGNSVSTRPERGKAMVLYFWAATDKFTPPDFVRSDAEDAAAISELYNTFHEQADFIGFPFNDSITTNRYLKTHYLPFPQAVGARAFERVEQITQFKYPFVMFISPNGRVAGISVGSLRRKNLIMKRYIPIMQACLKTE